MVYPRAGGETTSRDDNDNPLPGLSPRGRGNHHAWYAQGRHLRSIPARAGKPLGAKDTGRKSAVYPRAGGETGRAGRVTVTAPGLSPRGRGNPKPTICQYLDDRSIPARAGKPSMVGTPPASDRVYPRAGGETSRQVPGRYALVGLSPRGRGNPQQSAPSDRAVGSIPARAGKPSACSGRSWASAVYPRAGGETDMVPKADYDVVGLSPRGRGNHRGRVP